MVAVLLGVLTACSGSEEVDVPEDAVLLQGNIPTPVGEVTVVAGNIRDDEAALSAWGPGQPAENAVLEVGGTTELLGISFTLVATEVGDDDRDDLPDTRAWVVVGE